MLGNSILSQKSKDRVKLTLVFRSLVICFGEREVTNFLLMQRSELRPM